MAKWFGRKKREVPDFLQVPWGVRDVLVFIGLWIGLQILIGGILALTASKVPAVKMFWVGAQNGEMVASFVMYLVSVAVGFGLVGLFLRRYKVNWRTVGWRKVGVGRAMKYLLGVLVVFVVLANLALVAAKFLFPGFNADQPQTNDFISGAGVNHTLALVALVILPPIFEETIFRGFLFPALSKRGGVIWGAVLSSMIFGAAHGQPNLFVYTSILGLLLCFMYMRLRSIVPGIFLHMLNNYLAFIALSGK